MSSYVLRHIDPDLWRRFKSEAALHGMSIKALLEQFIRDWLTGRGK
jgi:plasmid stability protein